MINSYYNDKIEVGIDEAGAGCLMGDLYVAAVILPNSPPNDEESLKLYNLIKDSKKISEKKRNILFNFIKDYAIDYSIIHINTNIIDTINIRNARLQGFHKALDNLNTLPEHILVDGNIFNEYVNKDDFTIPHTCMTKGDTLYKNIAAASILAKVSRDNSISELHNQYPKYNWIKNKGYGTKEHISKIKEIGITPFHRISFTKHMT